MGLLGASPNEAFGEEAHMYILGGLNMALQRVLKDYSSKSLTLQS